MGKTEISEEFSDWEEIQYPYSNQPSSPSPQAQRLDLELVIRDNFYDDGSSIFPPSEHEDLPLVPEKCNSPENAVTASSSSPSPLPVSETDPTDQQRLGVNSKMTVINDGIRRMGKRMSAMIGYSFHYCRCPLMVPATALAAAVFACLKIVQWRNRVLLLIREKDQVINLVETLRKKISTFPQNNFIWGKEHVQI